MRVYKVVLWSFWIGLLLLQCQETRSQFDSEFIESLNQAATTGFEIPDHSGSVSVGRLEMSYSLRDNYFDNIKMRRALFEIEGDVGTINMGNMTARAFGDLVANATLTTDDAVYKFDIDAKYVLSIDRAQQTYLVNISKLEESILIPIKCNGTADDLRFSITDIDINPNTLLALSLAMRQAMYKDLEMMTCLYSTLEIAKGTKSLITLSGIYNFLLVKSNNNKSRDVSLNV